MWKHEILNSLYTDDRNKFFSKEMIYLINNAQTFYLGHIMDDPTGIITSLTKSQTSTKEPWFLSSITANRLPFPVSMFEYHDSYEDMNVTRFGTPSKDFKGKCCLLAQHIDNNIMQVYSITWNSIHDFWMIWPTIITIKVGSLFTEQEYNSIRHKFDLTPYNKTTGNLYLNYFNNPEGMKVRQLFSAEEVLSWDVPWLASFLMLLNCKNIRTHEILPPEKLNKKRMKNGKLPHYTYKVLKLKVMGDSSDNNNEIIMGDNNWENRMHFCRGHFKFFTDKKPLMGRHTGLYWWSSHIRGKNTEGFVDKEYQCAE